MHVGRTVSVRFSLCEFSCVIYCKKVFFVCLNYVIISNCLCYDFLTVNFYLIGVRSDSLWSGRRGIESRWEVRFSTTVQTGSEAHPASYTMGTGTFPGIKRPGSGVDHPLPCSAEVKERV